MKFFKTKTIITAAVTSMVVLMVRHIMVESNAFYSVPYKKTDITDTLRKETLSSDDYMLIFNQTGISPCSARELLSNGNVNFLEKLNNLYFKNPQFEKNFIVFPVTFEERNKTQITPVVPLKKGDILVTFNTRTLDWRHGHCGLVLDNYGKTLLEHTSIGKTSSITNPSYWGTYPAFAVLRHPDNDTACKAADYAKNNLINVPYNIFAGIFKKDKYGEKTFSSNCSHIVWQAYMAQKIDIDSDGGILVTPYDIAMSDKLKVVQIFGLNPQTYESRILK